MVSAEGVGPWGVKVGARRAPTAPQQAPPDNYRPAPIRARFRGIYPKVSQNPGVSPKSLHEACHTPYFKNRLIYHDLEFPDFPILPAFSHKE